MICPYLILYIIRQHQPQHNPDPNTNTQPFLAARLRIIIIMINRTQTVQIL